MKKVYSASVTPLYEDGSLDRQGLVNIFERNIRHGIDGVFILGSMGEWGSFDEGFKEELVSSCSEIIGGKMELLVGITATSLPLSLAAMRRYEKYKFDSYVLMLPGRTSSLDPVKSVLKVLDTADRPVFYYHCPPVNNIDFSLDQFAEIMKHPNLKGIKNSSSSMWLRRELLLLKQDRGFKAMLLEGQEWAADEAMIVGNDGILCGMGALGSKMMTGIARAVEAGNYQEAVRIQNVFIRLFHGVYGISLATVYSGQKYALYKMGVIASPFTMAQEMSVLTDQRKREIEACIEELKEEID